MRDLAKPIAKLSTMRHATEASVSPAAIVVGVVANLTPKAHQNMTPTHSGGQHTPINRAVAIASASTPPTLPAPISSSVVGPSPVACWADSVPEEFQTPVFGGRDPEGDFTEASVPADPVRIEQVHNCVVYCRAELHGIDQEASSEFAVYSQQHHRAQELYSDHTPFHWKPGDRFEHPAHSAWSEPHCAGEVRGTWGDVSSAYPETVGGIADGPSVQEGGPYSEQEFRFHVYGRDGKVPCPYPPPPVPLRVPGRSERDYVRSGVLWYTTLVEWLEDVVDERSEPFPPPPRHPALFEREMPHMPPPYSLEVWENRVNHWYRYLINEFYFRVGREAHYVPSYQAPPHRHPNYVAFEGGATSPSAYPPVHYTSVTHGGGISYGNVRTIRMDSLDFRAEASHTLDVSHPFDDGVYMM